MRVRGSALALAVLGLTACTIWHAQPLPTTPSRTVQGSGLLRAGLARVDLTPPPGVGLGGSGPDGLRAAGYRTRLFVTALVLEDSAGERIALVVADLPHVSVNLHRLTAERVAEATGIGADRLVMSATHTHSGPANFYAERQYNYNTARVVGYDPRMTDLLVERTSAAVERATASLAPAAIAWGETTVRGATTNRSLGAFCRNPEADSVCRASGDPRDAVDRSLVMLRVDALETRGGRRPLGSYMVFALHGTSIPHRNTLYDGDAHGRIVARLGKSADPSGRPTVHLLANGAEGDVSPDIERDDCRPVLPGLVERLPSPRGPGESVDFLEPPAAQVDRCLTDALDDVEAVADSVASAALGLYRTLEARLTSTASIRRAFSTEWLPGREGLCPTPVLGSAAAAGAEPLETRVRGWRWLIWPFLRFGFEEGGTAISRDDRRCQSPKLTLLDPFQAGMVVGEHGFPKVGQLSLIRIGDLLLATLPAEPTTMVGRRLRRGIEEAARAAAGDEIRVVVVGLTNGFIQYVTTAEEYQEQSYEGASNLYGPGTAEFLQRRMAELTRGLVGAGPSPTVEVGPVIAYPGPVKSLLQLQPAYARPPEGQIELRCVQARPVAEWLDLAPATVLASGRPWVVLEREDPRGWARVAEDGDGRLELYALGDRKGRGFAWRAVWRFPAAEGRFRLVRLEQSGGAPRTSDPAVCGSRRAGDVTPWSDLRAPAAPPR